MRQLALQTSKLSTNSTNTVRQETSVTENEPAYEPAERIGRRIDISVPHSARIFNYWLGGKDNYTVDRDAGELVRKTFPGIVDLARTGRTFLVHTVRHLVTHAGIRQFLDIGTGLPTADNTHEVAQRLAPEARIVYVDNDPLVLAHARALLTSTPQGATDYIDADLHDPDRILREAAWTLDSSQPVALLLMGILAHVSDYDEARSIVNRLMQALPSGSYLVIRDGNNTDPSYAKAIQGYNLSGAVPYHLRSPEQLTSFFDGLELLNPCVAPDPLWRPATKPPAPIGHPAVFGGIGRKP
jgi:hypothetical protein